MKFKPNNVLVRNDVNAAEAYIHFAGVASRLTVFYFLTVTIVREIIFVLF